MVRLKELDNEEEDAGTVRAKTSKSDVCIKMKRLVFARNFFGRVRMT